MQKEENMSAFIFFLFILMISLIWFMDVSHINEEYNDKDIINPWFTFSDILKKTVGF